MDMEMDMEAALKEELPPEPEEQLVTREKKIGGGECIRASQTGVGFLPSKSCFVLFAAPAVQH